MSIEFHLFLYPMQVIPSTRDSTTLEKVLSCANSTYAVLLHKLS